MEFVSRRELEKQALQNYDKNAMEIIGSAPLVAVYIFNKKLVKWEKLNCEGILFLYQKMHEPYYNLFLLNRLCNSHLYQPISQNLKLQVEDSYLLFKIDDGTIFGLWIHDKQIFDKLSNEISNIVQNISLNTFFRLPYDNSHSISRMFRKTEEEYLKSFFSLKRLQTNKEDDISNSNSVAKFFEDASRIFKNTKTALRFSPFSDNPTDNLLRKSVIRNPKYNVQCIENNQRYFVVSDICSD